MNIFNRTCRRPYLLWIVITVVGILLDQLTKLLVVKNMYLYESIPLWRGVLHITYIQNRGAAFGMLADQRWVFLIVSSITIVAMLIFLILTKSRNPLLLSSVAMILSGGIGNMIDRLALGYVVDMIEVRLINFAVFNVADSFVCVGAAILFLAVLLEKGDERTPETVAAIDKATFEEVLTEDTSVEDAPVERLDAEDTAAADNTAKSGDGNDL